MDKKIIKGLIDEKLETIQEQFTIIKEYEGKIPVIEIDLVMANIRDLYELFLTLQQQNTGMANPLQASPPETIQEPEPLPIPPLSVEPEPAQEIKPEAPVADPMPEDPAPVHRRAPGILSFEPVMDDEPAREHPPEKHPKITFDLFTDGSTGTLADRFKNDREKRIADQLGHDKVIDLKTTIGINDKFLFINELFEGNMRIYDDVILKLNDCMTMAQADLLLLDLKIVYNWDSDSPTVKKFVELVRRKF